MTLLEALKAINPDKMMNPSHGICDEVQFLLIQADVTREQRGIYVEQLNQLFLKWPEFSGHPRFPVPSPDDDLDELDFYMGASAHEMWSPLHPYGAARRRLLEYCINQLEKPNA